MSRQNFFGLLGQVLGFFGKLIGWASSLYVYDDELAGGIAVNLFQLFISYVVLLAIAKFVHELILNRKVNRNENV